MTKAELQNKVSNLNNSLCAVSFSDNGFQDILAEIEKLESEWETEYSKEVIREMKNIHNNMLTEVEKIKTVMFGINEMIVKLNVTKQTTGITNR